MCSFIFKSLSLQQVSHPTDLEGWRLSVGIQPIRLWGKAWTVTDPLVPNLLQPSLGGNNLDLPSKTKSQRKILEVGKMWQVPSGWAPGILWRPPGPWVGGTIGDWAIWGIYLEAAQRGEFRVVYLLQDSFLSLQHCLSQYPLVEVVKLTVVVKPILLTNLQEKFFWMFVL